MNADALAFLAAKGFTVEEIVEFARLSERKRDNTAAERQARHRAKKRNGVTLRRDPLIEEDHNPGSDISPSGENQNTAPIRRAGWPEIPAWMPAGPWNGYVESRRKMTARAVELAIANLERWRAKGHDPGAILDTSTQNGWTGLFEPKEPPNGRPGLHPANDSPGIRGSRPDPALDMLYQAQRELQAEAERENPGFGQPARLALPPH